MSRHTSQIQKPCSKKLQSYVYTRKMKLFQSNQEEKSPLLPSNGKVAGGTVDQSRKVGYESLLETESVDFCSSTSVSTYSRASSLAPFRPAALSWNNLNVYVKEQEELFGACLSKKQQTRKDGIKQILFQVSGTVKPGQLVAIIGASGAGKTTLLNSLTSRNVRNYQIDGEIAVNGENIGSEMTSISAYVQQEDLCIGALTVKEHLSFQALLRLPSIYSWNQKINRASNVMRELGLRQCENTLIGIPGQKKGISGGEKKRLAFASEALTNPSIFFCDEPTTGLDSFMAEQVVLFLKKMAQHGKTVLCTIHQPTSEVYSLFDMVYILGEGRTIFSGLPMNCLSFFKSAGYPCPKDFNPADFFIQTLAIVPGHEEECKDRITTLADSFKNSKYIEDVKRCDSYDASKSSSVEANFVYRYTAPNKLYPTTWLVQFFVLLWRSTLLSFRTRRLFVVRVIQKIIIGLFTGLIYFNTATNQKGIVNINGALFFSMMYCSTPSLMVILRFLPAEFPMLAREHHSGMYSVSSYYWSKVFSYLPLFTLDGIIFVSISYFMIGLRHTAGAFFLALLIIAMVEQTSAAFGTMLSVVAPSFPVAVTLAAPILTLCRLTTGLLANVGTLPAYISWIQYLSWWRYMYEAALINQWSGFQAIDCETPELSCLRTGDDILAQKSFAAQYFARDFVMEAVLMAVFYLIGYVVLCIKVYRAR